MKLHEEYNWDTYTDIYSNQLIGQRKNGDIFIVNKTKIVNGTVEQNGEILCFHTSDILQQIANYNPVSVFECGFGAGHQLYSVHKLFPNIKVGGVELLESQVNFGVTYVGVPGTFFENNDLSISDWSIPDSYKLLDSTYEFVYSAAVIMHLNTEKAVNFINNIIGMNPKYIVLKEGGTINHDWEELYRMTHIRDSYTMREYPPNDACSYNGMIYNRSIYNKDFVRKI